LRCLSAILILVLFSSPLMPLVLSADLESKLPACCRKDGKHRCGMKSEPASAITRLEQPSGAAVKSATRKCSQFPQGGSVPASTKIAVPLPAIGFSPFIIHHPAPAAEAEAQYRVSFSRARQKRGPPSLLF
jgi:hypothetical protein